MLLLAPFRPAPRPTFAVCRNEAELAPYGEAWDALAECCLEPSVFAERPFVEAALRHLGGPAVRILIVLAPGTEGRVPRLAGVFPLVEQPAFHRLPGRSVATWHHSHSYLGTPLVHRDYAYSALDGLFEYLDGPPSVYQGLDIVLVPSNGPFACTLRNYLESTGRAYFESGRSERAILSSPLDAESYLKRTISGKSRAKLRRSLARLNELGKVEMESFEHGDDVDRWISEFQTLELSGWKGALGTAVAQRAGDRAFFDELLRGYAARGRLDMLRCTLDGRAVALLVNFCCGAGSFAFKTSYDESLARYSPGVLLELEYIRRFLTRRDAEWVDSCAEPAHALMNRLWSERRTMTSFGISSARLGGRIAVSLLPRLSQLGSRARYWCQPTSAPIEDVGSASSCLLEFRSSEG